MRLPCPNTKLNEGHSAKISRNLGHFLQFLNFWPKKQVFLLDVPHHLVCDFDGDLLLRKTQHFWSCHGKICMPTNGQEILTGFELPKRSKTPQK